MSSSLISRSANQTQDHESKMLSGVAVTSLTFVYFLPAYMEESVRKQARHFPVVALVLVMTKGATVCLFVNFVSNNDYFFCSILAQAKDPELTPFVFKLSITSKLSCHGNAILIVVLDRCLFIILI